MKGTEHKWFRKDVEKWFSRGLKYGGGFESALEVCPITDYHINYFMQYKEEIAEEFYHNREVVPQFKDWLKALEIKLKPQSVLQE